MRVTARQQPEPPRRSLTSDGHVGEDHRQREPSDADLLQQIVNGGDVALETLCERYERRLLSYINGRVRDGVMAQELTCQVLADVWRGAKGFRGLSSVSTWIFGIARRTVLHYLSRRPRALESDNVLATAVSDDRHVLELLSGEQAAILVRRALEALPAEQREVIELNFYHEFSYAQIAEITGCPLNTVKARAYYARQHLKRLLCEMEEH